jgi:hypothetical protein
MTLKMTLLADYKQFLLDTCAYASDNVEKSAPVNAPYYKQTHTRDTLSKHIWAMNYMFIFMHSFYLTPRCRLHTF